jgi:hypothetical protein
MFRLEAKPKILRKAVCFFALLVVAACKAEQPAGQDSELDGFLANNDGKWAKNYIAAFLGDSTNIPGTLQDIGNISRVFNPQNGFNFVMPGPQDGGWKHATSDQVIRETANIARQMLETDMQAWKNLQPGGTLFFYMTSHGAPDGSTSTQGGSFQFSQVAAAIREARGGHPLERLVVMYDTCFSGQNITGNRAISQNTGSTGGGSVLTGGGTPGAPQGGGLGDLISMFGGYSLQGSTGLASAEADLSAQTSQMINSVADAATSMKGLYKSGIFIGASLPSETSGDESAGGTGTLAFLASVNAARRGLTSTGGDVLSSLLNGGAPQNSSPASTGSTAKVSDVLDGMVRRAQGQTPVWCVEPVELKDDFFFDAPAGWLPAWTPSPGSMQRFCRNGRS